MTAAYQFTSLADAKSGLRPDSTAIRQRLDYLFRTHCRGDEAGRATTVLRGYIEAYRRQGEAQTGTQAETQADMQAGSQA